MIDRVCSVPQGLASSDHITLSFVRDLALTPSLMNSSSFFVAVGRGEGNQCSLTHRGFVRRYDHCG